MKQNSLPMITTQDSHARRSYRIEAPDQVAAKYLALFLMDRGIYFLFLGFFRGSCQGEICFSVPKAEASEIESFLTAIPTARPSSTECLAPHFYAGADAGRLHLAASRHILAQVTSRGETEYLADIWNAFAPGSQADVDVTNPAPIPVLSTPVSQLA